jgi:hypothetical protein
MDANVVVLEIFLQKISELRVGEEERRKKSSSLDCWSGVYLEA